MLHVASLLAAVKPVAGAMRERASLNAGETEPGPFAVAATVAAAVAAEAANIAERIDCQVPVQASGALAKRHLPDAQNFALALAPAAVALASAAAAGMWAAVGASSPTVLGAGKTSQGLTLVAGGVAVAVEATTFAVLFVALAAGEAVSASAAAASVVATVAVGAGAVAADVAHLEIAGLGFGPVADPVAALVPAAVAVLFFAASVFASAVASCTVEHIVLLAAPQLQLHAEHLGTQALLLDAG